jgi:hypothetical protein
LTRSSRPRKTANLSDSVQHKLNMYALAAGAAGVSTLALSQVSEAKIVYTPAHVVLHARSNTQYYLDLNHDGVKDFSFSHGYNYSSTTGFLFSIIQMEPYKFNANRIAGRAYAFALRTGDKVGPSDAFSHNGIMAVARATGRSGSRTFQGEWVNNGKGLANRYLGLMFTINGKPHYGWARVTIKVINNRTAITATLTGYAYETIPNKAIIAGRTKGPDGSREEDFGPNASLTSPIPDIPQPASLGALAMGAPGLSIWRREESASEMQ